MRLAFIALIAVAALGQNRALSPSPKLQFVDDNNRPLVGGKICTYQAGTMTPLVTYQSSDGSANTNPIILDSRGEANIWLGDTGPYKFILRQPGGVSTPFATACNDTAEIWTVDQISDTGQLLRRDLANTTDPALGDALVGVKQPVSGTVATTQHEVNSRLMAVQDFGAVGDSVTNDTAAFTAACAGTRSILVPAGTYAVNTATIPGTCSLVVLNGGSIQVATGQTLTMNSMPNAGNYQIFSGSGSVIINGGLNVNAMWFSGSDIFAKIKAAAVALNNCRGKIEVPRGDFTVSTNLDVSGSQGCIIFGQGGPTGGATPGTRITYTGNAARMIDARSTAGFHLSDIQFLATNETFAGIGVDLSHSSGGGDSAYSLIERNGFFATPLAGGGASFDIVINLDQVINARVVDNALQTYRIGVMGVAEGCTGTCYSNTITLQNNIFGSVTAAASQAHIYSPGEAWNILGNSFEMGTATGTAKVVECPNRVVTKNVVFQGNWVGDWGPGPSSPMNLQVCGSAWNINGNLFGTRIGTPTTNVQITQDARGIIFQSNIIISDVGDTAFNLGNNVKGLFVMSNYWGPIANFLTGFELYNGIVEDTNNKVTVYAATDGVGITGAISMLKAVDCTGLPDQVGGSGGMICGGFETPVIAKQYVGDGSGYEWQILSRTGGVDTVLGWFDDVGNFHYPHIHTDAITADGNPGLTTTVTVRKGDDSGSCVLTFTGGILTGNGC